MPEIKFQLDGIKEVEKIIASAVSAGCDIQTKEGTVSDFHIIHTYGGFNLKGNDTYKYIILYYVFENHWENTYWCLLTDSVDTVSNYATEYGLEEEPYI